VAERKDVLSAMFWFLGIYAYLRYLESPSPTRYLVILAADCLGLMSKSMLVTFPMTLLLFDMWPLKRPLNLKLVWEKLPLFGLTAIFSVITYWVQGSAGAFSEVPFGGRVENALVSYVIYIQKLFWPAGLAMFYMYPPSTPLWQPISALAALVAITALAIYTCKKRPYFISGWLWYLGTLVPVIGLVQVGAQSRGSKHIQPKTSVKRCRLVTGRDPVAFG
jgi:protein O-mannosyl-transferase